MAMLAFEVPLHEEKFPQWGYLPHVHHELPVDWSTASVVSPISASGSSGHIAVSVGDQMPAMQGRVRTTLA